MATRPKWLGRGDLGHPSLASQWVSFCKSLTRISRSLTASSLAGPECIEGELTPEELKAGCNDQTVDNRNNRFLDEEYYHSRTYKLSDIEVPTLSVANLGGNTLHLRGNVVGYLETGTKFKWLWFVSGR